MQGHSTTSLHLCECGCGQPTKIAKVTSVERGWIRGQPLRFIRFHRLYERTSPVDRFWSKVNKNGPIPSHCPELGQCWVWTGGRPHGYGRLNVNREMVPAHRFSYELHYGPLTETLNACHHCDNPACVRPDHLFAGTDGDNVRDCIAKGRKVMNPCKGERNGRAVLTGTDVLAIRQQYALGGITLAALGRQYGVTYQQIRAIVCGKEWRHLPL